METTCESTSTHRRRTRPVLIGATIAALVVGSFVAANASAGSPAEDTVSRRGNVNSDALVAGATFVPVTPYRAFDSRFPSICSGDVGPFGPNEALVIDVAVDQNDGCNVKIPTANLVAVTYNLTVVNTVGRGFLSIAPTRVPSVATSAVNWTETGQIVPNGGVVGVGEAFEAGLGFVLVESGPNGSTNFFIDITGYYTL